MDTADHLVFDHAGHFAGLASLDPQTGLVVSIRLHWKWCERDDHVCTASCWLSRSGLGCSITTSGSRRVMRVCSSGSSSDPEEAISPSITAPVTAGFADQETCRLVRPMPLPAAVSPATAPPPRRHRTARDRLDSWTGLGGNRQHRRPGRCRRRSGTRQHTAPDRPAVPKRPTCRRSTSSRRPVRSSHPGRLIHRRP